jgi:hypothetical protein
MMGDDAHAADMQLFHQLFAHRSEITRNVVMRPDGIETVTESMNPDVTRSVMETASSLSCGVGTLSASLESGVLETRRPGSLR